VNGDDLAGASRWYDDQDTASGLQIGGSVTQEMSCHLWTLLVQYPRWNFSHENEKGVEATSEA